jgi:hypothetical protein
MRKSVHQRLRWKLLFQQVIMIAVAPPEDSPNVVKNKHLTLEEQCF